LKISGNTIRWKFTSCLFSNSPKTRWRKTDGR